MWLFERLHPGTVANRLAYAFRIQNALEVPAFVAAMQQLVDRHPMLRATFDELDGVPSQTVHRHHVVDCLVESAAGWGDDRLSERLAAEAGRPFDLRNGPLVRFCILSRSPAEHVLLLSMHHLIVDMWSIALVGYELTKLYELGVGGACESLPAPRARYGDFVRAEQDMVASAEGARHLAFWRDELAGAPATLGLRPDRPRLPTTTDRGGTQSLGLGAEMTAALRRLAAATSATLHDVVLAGFTTVLHRHTAQDDVVVGCMKANRSASTARVVGCFVNPIAVRTQFTDDPSFAELVGRVHRTMNATSRHVAYPFQKVAEELLPAGARRASQSPYFQAVFSWQRTTRVVDRNLVASAALGTTGTESSVNGLRFASIPVGERAAPYDITLLVGEVGDELIATFEYKFEVFDAATVARMATHLQRVLAAAAADPDCRVGELPLLSGGELAELEAWAGSVGEGGGGVGVGGLFEAQVAVAPGAVAVRFEGERLSLGELNVRANRLARHLVASGVGAGELVGVWLERSLEMVVAVMAVVKSGGAFVPLDPAFPADRLEFMVADSGARVVVTDSGLLAGGGLGAGVEYVCVDRDAGLIGGYAGEDPGLGGAGDDLAYVIYTSGSTGRPKGVQVEHRSLANLLGAMAKRPGLAAGDVVVSVTTLSFDIALVELLVPLVVGAEVVVVGRETAADGPALVAELARSGATVMQATPSTWRMLIEAGWLGDGRLKALCGGEAMSRDLADQLLARCGSVWNMYGPTETTVWSAVAEVTAGDGPVPIGTPVDNTQLYVLDAHRQLLPVGVPGELFIGGEGVARGYLGRPELTAERFVPDPFRSAPGARMYRTGDLVRRRLPSGDIEFLGRVDTQLKVRGYRIEPGEIESVLVEHPDVAQAVVAAHEHGPGDTRLAAYIVPASPASPPHPHQLRAHLRTKLPDYMVPAAYILLPALPTTPNNKIDRTQLPNPDADAAPAAVSSAPRPGLEAELASIWEGVLGVKGIGRDDDFFDLGGHSLLATQIASRIRAGLGVELPVASVFEHPTVSKLTLVVARSRTSGSDEVQPTPPRGGPPRRVVPALVLAGAHVVPGAAPAEQVRVQSVRGRLADRAPRCGCPRVGAERAGRAPRAAPHRVRCRGRHAPAENRAGPQGRAPGRRLPILPAGRAMVIGRARDA